MGNTTQQRIARERFITEHREKIKELVTEFGDKGNGRHLPGKVLNWINHTARPALGYSAKTDSLQIWFTIRRDYQRVAKQVDQMYSVGPLTMPQKMIAHSVFNTVANYRVFLGLRTGKTFLFTYLDRYLSTHPQNPSVEDFEQFIHKNPPQ